MPDVSQIMADIEARLEKATPGEWTIEAHGDGEVLYAGRGPMTHGLNLVYLREGDWNWEHNRAYIAACSPDRIRALLDEVKRKDEHIELLQSKIDAEKSRACSFDRPDDVCAVHSPRFAAAEIELARLRERLENKSRMYRRCVERSDKDVNRAEAAQAELARLREPAGDVGNLVQRLNDARKDWEGILFWHLAGEAADLLLRQAGEIEEAQRRYDGVYAQWGLAAKLCDEHRTRAETAEARGYAAAREQAAGIADGWVSIQPHHTSDEVEWLRSFLAAGQAIRKMEPNT